MEWKSLALNGRTSNTYICADFNFSREGEARLPTGKRQQNRGNVGKCKGIDSKLYNRKSDEDQRSTLQHKVTEQVPSGSKRHKYKYRLLKTVFHLGVISFLFIETWHAT